MKVTIMFAIYTINITKQKKNKIKGKNGTNQHCFFSLFYLSQG